jgi:glycosyltransferase involved in cell wall biosynthesis
MTLICPTCYGASRMAAHYATAFRDRGHDVHIAYTTEVPPGDSGGGSILPELHAIGVTSQLVPNLANYMNPFLSNPLIQIAQERGSEIIISNTMRDAPAAMKAARKIGIPGIVFAQNLPRFGGGAVLRLLKRWLYMKTLRDVATHVICVANGVARELIESWGIPKNQVSVSPNGLDLSAIPPEPAGNREAVRTEFGLSDELLLINLARIHEQKGHIYLVEAIRMIRDAGDCPPVKLLVIGDVESQKEKALKARLQEYVRTHQLEQQIQFVGFRSDGYRLLQAADLFVLSSVWEGLPLVVIEAMGVKCPVLMTEYGDRFDHFRDGVDGLYVKVCDSQALADGLRLLLKATEASRREMGQNGREYVEKHLTMERGKQLFVQSVDEVLKRHCDVKNSVGDHSRSTGNPQVVS